MDKGQQIRQRLKEMASEVGPAFSMIAQVKSIDTGAMTCDLFDEESGLDFFDVRLRPVLDGNKSLTLIPKINTWALAVRIESTDDWMLIAAGELDKWTLNIGNAILEQNATGLLIKNGADTLRAGIELIVEAVQQIVVLQGTNPDYAKLQQGLAKVQNVLR